MKQPIRSAATFVFGTLAAALTLMLAIAQQSVQAPPPTPPPQSAGRGAGRGTPPPPPVTPKPEELAKVKDKTEQIEALVKDLRANHANPELLGDVEVYAKAGRMLLEFPDMFGTQAAIEHSFLVLDQGIERAKQLQSNQPQWNQGKKQIHAYYSEIDGAVLPYGITLPENYDPAKPTRLYVWLHGRQNNTTEAEFIYGFLTPRPPGNAPVADQGQIQLDCFGRINGAGWHWAGEMDVFESIAAVKKRFHIDDKRIILRGFSQGGEGAWHISLHHPDAFAAAEIGAGTVSRTAQRPGLPALSTSHPAHLGEHLRVGPQHLQSAARRTRWRERSRPARILAARPRATGKGRLSVRRRPGLPAVQGAPGLWMQSKNTGHGTSPLVRQRLDHSSRSGATKVSRRPTTSVSSPTPRAITAITGSRWTGWRSTTNAPMWTHSAPAAAPPTTSKRET